MQARAAARENESDTPVVPITVRQLEAVVRISESYARMQLQVSCRKPYTSQTCQLIGIEQIRALSCSPVPEVWMSV